MQNKYSMRCVCFVFFAIGHANVDYIGCFGIEFTKAKDTRIIVSVGWEYLTMCAGYCNGYEYLGIVRK